MAAGGVKQCLPHGTGAPGADRGPSRETTAKQLFTIKRWTWLPLFVVGVTGLAACERGPDEAEDVPIVVEESEPIALGEPEEEGSEEVQLVDDEEPRVITRTVVVRERP